MSLRRISMITVLSALALSGAGCGSDSGEPGVNPIESATTRRIREEVRAELEMDRLKRLAPRIAHATESAAASPSAVVLAKASASDDGSAAAADEVTGIERGEQLYQANCASCHGATGNSDGPVAASLQPKPSRHSDGNYMNALSYEHLVKVIKEGGPAVGKSAMMAPWGTTLSQEKIDDVILYVRSLASPPFEG